METECLLYSILEVRMKTYNRQEQHRPAPFRRKNHAQNEVWCAGCTCGWVYEKFYFGCEDVKNALWYWRDRHMTNVIRKDCENYSYDM